MMKNTIAALLVLPLVSVGPSVAFAQSAPQPVTLLDSELHQFRAKDGSAYDISVAFPLNHDPDAGVEHPVLYVTMAPATLAWIAQPKLDRDMAERAWAPEGEHD